MKCLIVLEEEKDEMEEAEKVPSECLSPRSQESCDSTGNSFIAGSEEEEEEGDTEMEESEEGSE